MFRNRAYRLSHSTVESSEVLESKSVEIREIRDGGVMQKRKSGSSEVEVESLSLLSISQHAFSSLDRATSRLVSSS